MSHTHESRDQESLVPDLREDDHHKGEEEGVEGFGDWLFFELIARKGACICPGGLYPKRIIVCGAWSFGMGDIVGSVWQVGRFLDMCQSSINGSKGCL